MANAQLQIVLSPQQTTFLLDWAAKIAQQHSEDCEPSGYTLEINVGARPYRSVAHAKCGSLASTLAVFLRTREPMTVASLWLGQRRYIATMYTQIPGPHREEEMP